MSHPSTHSTCRRPPAAMRSRARNPPPPCPAICTAHHGDYTLVHGGRQVRIGPVAFWIVVGTLVVMAVWSIATGTYFAFRDDVLTRLIGAPGRNAIRLRGPHRRIARAGRPHHQPAIARPGAVRAKAQRAAAAASGIGAAHLGAHAATVTTGSIRARAQRAAGGSAGRQAGQGFADQRHGHLHRAARPRGAA